MRWTTITARFAGTCRRCHGRITAGDKIRYGGRGLTYHLSGRCPAGKGGVKGKARCEDAPCCGCCDANTPTFTVTAGHAPDVDRVSESESEAWARRYEEGWGPGGY